MIVLGPLGVAEGIVVHADSKTKAIVIATADLVKRIINSMGAISMLLAINRLPKKNNTISI